MLQILYNNQGMNPTRLIRMKYKVITTKEKNKKSLFRLFLVITKDILKTLGIRLMIDVHDYDVTSLVCFHFTLDFQDMSRALREVKTKNIPGTTQDKLCNYVEDSCIDDSKI